MESRKRPLAMEETAEPAFEIWKDVTGYEGVYQVSNHGAIRSLRYRGKAGRIAILKQYPDKGGYMRTKLCANGKEITVKVHRIVAAAFVPNPGEKREVNHLDGNTMNNVASNLEWVTPSENMKHASRIGVVVSPVIKPVEQRSLDGSLVRVWPSARVAAISLGADAPTITKCCKGKLKQTNGYRWNYRKG